MPTRGVTTRRDILTTDVAESPAPQAIRKAVGHSFTIHSRFLKQTSLPTIITQRQSPLLQINSRATSEVRAPIAAAETVAETPVKMQATPATATPTPAPASTLVPSQAVQPAKRTASDYIFGKLIGDGCYSTVFLAKDIHSGKEVASKCARNSAILLIKKKLNTLPTTFIYERAIIFFYSFQLKSATKITSYEGKRGNT